MGGGGQITENTQNSFGSLPSNPRFDGLTFSERMCDNRVLTTRAAVGQRQWRCEMRDATIRSSTRAVILLGLSLSLSLVGARDGHAQPDPGKEGTEPTMEKKSVEVKPGRSVEGLSGDELYRAACENARDIAIADGTTPEEAEEITYMCMEEFQGLKDVEKAQTAARCFATAATPEESEPCFNLLEDAALLGRVMDPEVENVCRHAVGLFVASEDGPPADEFEMIVEECYDDLFTRTDDVKTTLFPCILGTTNFDGVVACLDAAEPEEFYPVDELPEAPESYVVACSKALDLLAAQGEDRALLEDQMIDCLEDLQMRPEMEALQVVDCVMGADSFDVAVACIEAVEEASAADFEFVPEEELIPLPENINPEWRAVCDKVASLLAEVFPVENDGAAEMLKTVSDDCIRSLLESNEADREAVIQCVNEADSFEDMMNCTGETEPVEPEVREIKPLILEDVVPLKKEDSKHH